MPVGRPTKISKRETIELYTVKDWTTWEIAEWFGVNKETIANALRRWGIRKKYIRYSHAIPEPVHTALKQAADERHITSQELMNRIFRACIKDNLLDAILDDK